MKPRLLDLFCGAGGAAMGYHRAGFDIVGVDIAPQPHYPFEFIQGDATKVFDAVALQVGADIVHASPPCQAWTAYRRRGGGVGDTYSQLIGEVRSILRRSRLPYVIENVAGAPLYSPIMLCGSAFGLDVRRHRYFESNAALMALPCAHFGQRPRFRQATNRTRLRKTVEVGVWRIPLATQKAAMGVDWECSLRELSEMVPPAYTEFIGEQLLAAVGMSTETEAL